MATTAYGSITIIDVSDFGELSVTPQSNQPTTVIYDPNGSGTYTPDWAQYHLVLTPVIYYGGTRLVDGSSVNIPSSAILKITWKQQLGSGTPTVLVDKRTITSVTDAQLTVNTNPFDSANINLVNYIVEITYKDSSIGVDLTSSGQISYSLVKNATYIKDITITGESAFLYRSNGEPVNSNITLRVRAEHVSIGGWYYVNSNDEDTKITSAGTDATWTINESTHASYFNSDVAVIKVKNSDGSIYDVHTIIKIRDGANGTSLDNAVLSNEDQMVPCNANGEPIVGAFDQCTTKITIYEGNVDKTSEWDIALGKGHGVDGNFSNYEFTATSLTSDTGYVTFTCTKTGHTTLVKTFSLVKVKAGADGESPVIYSLEVNALAVNKASNGSYTPGILVLNAYKYEGNTKTPYNGRFKIYTDDSSEAYIPDQQDVPTISYTVANVNSKLRIELYSTGSFNTKLDTQTVIITSDGEKGDQGDEGAAALNFILSNYSDLIPCDNNGVTLTDKFVTIPFTAYEGINRVACTISPGDLPTGGEIVVESNSRGNTDAEGTLVLKFVSGKTLSGDSGNIPLTITAKGKTQTFNYSWAKNKKALNGTPARVFQVYAPNGNVISNDSNNVDLKPLFIEGTTDITDNYSYTWKYFNGSQYTPCTVEAGYTISTNTRQLTISPTAVNSYVSIQCIVGTTGNEAYFSVYDKTDPIQVSVLSTLGDKLINSVGNGIIYALVYRNGVELDPMKTIKCGTSYPTTASIGDYFWLLNTTNHSATLKKKGSSAWTDAEASQYTYNWTATNVDPSDSNYGHVTSYQGKAIYLDASIVDKKTQFYVTVTTNA